MWILVAALAHAAGAAGAVHVGTLDGNGIAWESTLSGDGALTLADGRVVLVKGRQTLTTHQDDLLSLRPPLLADTWQRIDLVGLDWTPDPALGLERRVDGWCAPSFGLEERLRLEGLDPHIGFSTFVDGRVATLAGSVAPTGRVGLGAALGTAGLFVAAVFLMLAGRKALARKVQLEEAEAYLRKEFERAP
jgi:hypothetical protein